MGALQFSPSRFLVPALLAATLLGAQPPAHAESPAGGASTRWQCWYNKDETVRCRLAAAPIDPAAAQPVAIDPHPSLLPRRGPLPEVVHVIHEQPARLRERTITIPLFSEPEDMAFTEQLAKAVMCGGRPTCAVDFIRSVADLAMLDADDPALD